VAEWITGLHEEGEGRFMSGTALRTKDWEQMAIQAEFKPARMASLCSMSERHLQRIFKRHLHRTPSQWLRELQCRLAKQLISQGYSSKAAAAELNFATDAHFCREFKKVFGMPPQTFAPSHGMSLKLSVLDTASSVDSAELAHV
jgi:AraC-like DNA-binding protein